ncbi:MAG TPA: hypothetical protein VNF92_06925 [Gemmatimonadaceae bacterium]|nr:hypothetical protein [Gemmatimonadaceae bacterium]
MTEGREDAGTPLSTRPAKTPMYQAIHAARYHRQERIREIQEVEGNCLLCYVCGPRSSIDRDDVVFFADLVHNVQRGSNIDLLLHTGGGDIDAAEKLVTLLRNWVGNGRLRVIVPDFAKSAGTLMAIGADCIVMSDTSELGPIDPQIVVADANGNRVAHSVKSYLDAYGQHAEALRANPTDPVARMMLDKLDPGTLKLFEAVHRRSQKLAEDQLKTGMLRDKGNYTSVAAKLIDTDHWLTHGKVINRQAAEAMELDVAYLPATEDVWRRYWQLYCLQRLSLSDGGKLFESEHVSLPVSG